jgi:hypothetical protein
LLSRWNAETRESNKNKWKVNRRLKDIIIEPCVDEAVQSRGFLSCCLVTYAGGGNQENESIIE